MSSKSFCLFFSFKRNRLGETNPLFSGYHYLGSSEDKSHGFVNCDFKFYSYWVNMPPSNEIFGFLSIQ